MPDRGQNRPFQSSITKAKKTIRRIVGIEHIVGVQAYQPLLAFIVNHGIGEGVGGLGRGVFQIVKACADILGTDSPAESG